MSLVLEFPSQLLWPASGGLRCPLSYDLPYFGLAFEVFHCTTPLDKLPLATEYKAIDPCSSEAMASKPPNNTCKLLNNLRR